MIEKFLPTSLIVAKNRVWFFLKKHSTLSTVGISTLVMLLASYTFLKLTPETSPELSQLPSLTTPLPKPSITSVDDTVELSQKITFTGEKPTFPSEVGILRSTYVTTSTQSVINQLATDFSLQSSGQGTWTNNNDTSVLNYLVEDGFLVYDSPFILGANTTFSSEKIVRATREFMTKYLQPNPPTEFKVTYLTKDEDGFELEESDDPTALFASVTLTPMYYSLPVRFKNHSDTANFLILDQNYQPIKFAITPELYATEPIAKTNTISIDQAIKNMENGVVTIVDVYSPLSVNRGDGEGIENTILNKVEMEYRLDPSTNYFTPYYHFYGDTSIDHDSPTYAVELITPAVELAQ